VHLEELHLVDVRSYARADVLLQPGVALFVGPNGQGKTNLLEAVQRAAAGESHRVASDAPLVRVPLEDGDGTAPDIGVIRTVLRTDEGRRRTVELEVGTGRRTRTKVDGQDVRRASDAIGVLRAVLFAPEDLAIVRGQPGERRRFLDDLLVQRRPAYAATRGEYDRILRQRNALLKQLRGGRGSRGGGAGDADATLAVFDEQLARHGATVWAARLAAVHALSGPVDRAYRDVADRPEAVTLTYQSSTGEEVVGEAGMGVPDPGPLHESFVAALAEVADDERRRGTTLVGPHRDELELRIGRMPARGYASHGETWSLALALKLGVHQVIAEVGDSPVVLLDDVFAELDETRRARLAEACDGFDQVLVTAAVEADVPLDGARYDVSLHDGCSQVRRRT
jgi:DNA replication and repair protein RecF